METIDKKAIVICAGSGSTVTIDHLISYLEKEFGNAAVICAQSNRIFENHLETALIKMRTTTKTDGKGNTIVIPDPDHYDIDGLFRKHRDGGNNRRKTKARRKRKN